MTEESRDQEPREPENPTPLSIGQKILLTSEEAAALFSVSERTLWDLTKEGRIPCVWIGTLKRYRRAALEAWAEAEEGRPRQPARTRQRRPA
jgi:excisionase family DNA binding protein